MEVFPIKERISIFSTDNSFYRSSITFHYSLCIAEALYMWRPCSRSFIPEAKSVLEELDIEDMVKIKTTSCLGDCDKPVVLKF